MMDPGQKLVLVLAAEGDATVAPILRSLEVAGFRAAQVSSATELRDAMDDESPDLVLLDMDIPGVPGTDLLRGLRAHHAGEYIPLIAVSSSTDPVDRIVALELGADDYVARPFSIRELTLRVRAVLSRSAQRPAKPRLTIGRVSLSPETREVLVDGTPQPLSALDYRLLAALFEEGGRVVSRERLIALAWGAGSAVSPRTVDTQLRRLRTKLGPAADSIRTVRGFGYQLSE